MGLGHTHTLRLDGHGPLHDVAPEVKVAAAFGIVLAVALTPVGNVSALLAHGLLVVGLVQFSQLPLGFFLRRLVVVLPFVLFAVAIPFVASGERTTILGGLAVSREGLDAAITIVAKTLLGAGVSIVLAGTTEPRNILRGLGRLHVPPVLTTIAAFMLRYVEVISAELGRMRTAMSARGHDPRWLWQARPIATGAGALFVRSYERGERVHAAMLARGFDGVMPDLDVERATRGAWAMGGVPVLYALAVTTLAVLE